MVDEKSNQGEKRKEKLNAYEELRQQVEVWETDMEERINALEPVAVDTEVLLEQINSVQPLLTEYREYSPTIDKVNELGMLYDTMLNGERAASPVRRLGRIKRATSETKEPESSAPATLVSPVSSASSGISSRSPSDQLISSYEEMTPVQQQLTDINHRYELIGKQLTDRQAELGSTQAEVRRHLDELQAILNWIEEKKAALPSGEMPTTPADIHRQLLEDKVRCTGVDSLFEN